MGPEIGRLRERYATFELKDKPFTGGEVMEYARKALTEGCRRFTFVFGQAARNGIPYLAVLLPGLSLER